MTNAYKILYKINNLKLLKLYNFIFKKKNVKTELKMLMILLKFVLTYLNFHNTLSGMNKNAW